jgi:hypothetical protein
VSFTRGSTTATAGAVYIVCLYNKEHELIGWYLGSSINAPARVTRHLAGLGSTGIRGRLASGETAFFTAHPLLDAAEVKELLFGLLEEGEEAVPVELLSFVLRYGEQKCLDGVFDFSFPDSHLTENRSPDAYGAGVVTSIFQQRTKQLLARSDLTQVLLRAELAFQRDRRAPAQQIYQLLKKLNERGELTAPEEQKELEEVKVASRKAQLRQLGREHFGSERAVEDQLMRRALIGLRTTRWRKAGRKAQLRQLGREHFGSERAVEDQLMRRALIGLRNARSRKAQLRQLGREHFGSGRAVEDPLMCRALASLFGRRSAKGDAALALDFEKLAPSNLARWMHGQRDRLTVDEQNTLAVLKNERLRALAEYNQEMGHHLQGDKWADMIQQEKSPFARWVLENIERYPVMNARKLQNISIAYGKR